jgi:mono/diheme cytochrome c family protein
MKRIFALTGLFIALAGIASLFSGCATSKPLTARQADYPADKVDARGIFLENCARCHGQNGRAHTFHGWLVGAQNLTKPKFQAEISDQEIIHAIKTGPEAMPAFEKKLSPSEIEALAMYVRSFGQTH